MKEAHAALARLVEQRLAIRLGPERPHDSVSRWVRERTRVLGLAGPETYVDRLTRDGPDSPEFLALIRQVTNGQTYFFRDVEQLEVALTLLAAQKRVGPRRIYLAACSTGEEPYSLLMMALERGLDLQIMASDVNDERLAIARAAVYSTQAIAKIPPRFKQRFVEPYGSLFRMSASLRDRVRFEKRNLLDPSVPRPDAESRWDLILCRNVFIYFGGEQIRDISRAFASVLAPDGTLVLGSSETLRGLDVPFESVMYGPRTVYQLARFAAEKRSSIPPVPMTPPDSMMVPLGRMSSAPPPPVQAPTSVLRPEGRTWLDRGHEHLRQHEFNEADACYDAALRVEDLHPEPHFFRGLVACKRGATQLAIESFRRALFLEPKMWPARILLAGALDRVGDSRGVLRELEALEASLARESTRWHFESNARGIASATIVPDEARNVISMRRQALARSAV
jgi:chemotaxis protein methyltransferase CheR